MTQTTTMYYTTELFWFSDEELYYVRTNEQFRVSESWQHNILSSVKMCDDHKLFILSLSLSLSLISALELRTWVSLMFTKSGAKPMDSHNYVYS